MLHGRCFQWFETVYAYPTDIRDDVKTYISIIFGFVILYQIFIGGLVVDFERRIIGVAFLGKDTTHIVPTEIMARCVKHFKKFRCYLFSLGLGYVIYIVLFSFVCAPLHRFILTCACLSKLDACEVVFNSLTLYRGPLAARIWFLLVWNDITVVFFMQWFCKKLFVLS